MFQQIVGYIVIAAILTIVLNIFSKIFASIKYFFQGKKIEQQLKKQAQEYINKKTEQEKDSSVRKFYGLFEFDFKDCPDEEGLKKDYCSMIDEKIRTKYRNSSLQLSATDKVFFNCSDFSKLDNIVDDFVKLYN
ncbi:hypothetical protein IJ531_05050, partial [bacterium]|nr:hypothetical protein [bacterium]